MIKIEETFPDAASVVIRLAGRLDRRTLPALEEVCQRRLETKRRVVINLEDLTHIGSEGRAFLKSIRGSVHLVGVRNSLRLEFDGGADGRSRD